LFKRIAETHGLDAENVRLIGWAKTALTDKSEAVIGKFLTDEKVIFRLPVTTGKRIKSSSTRKYICPRCGAGVRATKEVRVISGDCNEFMQKQYEKQHGKSHKTAEK
jgi:uncharacterized protein YlaI